uniref:FAM192A/Fyv6 N-terminal domain-containing protein n=1 Tax=Rhipicephalus appendiculatus TaxID=34631 RepID=A0A131YDU1_RHIAP
MSFGGSTSQETIPKFKSFVSESELEEKRRKRQEEWEKVRKADDPVEAPEEEYDPRSLFERLEEQRLKKQADYEEAHKLKNMIRGLDDDEVTFLEYVDMRKQEIESQRMKEDMQEIEEYRISFTLITECTSQVKKL